MGMMLTLMKDGFHIPAYRAGPAGRCKGGIVLIHEVWGLTGHIKNVADRLAAEGYLVLAPNLLSGTDIERHMTPDMPKDLFNPATRNEVQPRLRQLMAPLQTPEFAEDTVNKLRAVFACLYEEDACRQKVAVIGFCFGGTYSFSLEAAEPRLQAAIPFYGHSNQTGAELRNISCPILYLLGENDGNLMQSLPGLTERMHETGADFTVRVYEACGHAFFNDSNPYAYNEAAASDAWKRTLAFLESAFAEKV